MGYRNREIEKKYVASKVSMEDAIKLVGEVLEDWESILHDASKDFYWDLPKGVTGDFVRLRYMPEGSGQLTVKHADRNDNTNRVEIDVEVTEPDQGKALLTHLFGDATKSVHKEYYVFFLENKDTTISIYRVRGDKRIFIEIEARTLDRVNKLEKLIGAAIEMNREPRSLYQIFVREK